LGEFLFHAYGILVFLDNLQPKGSFARERKSERERDRARDGIGG